MTTPSPWRIDDDGAIRTMDGRDVVTAFDHRVVVTDADARLIAAAPELLQACERLMSWIDNWAPAFVQDPEWAADLEFVINAMVKAKGDRS